ncbi:uncharacterized protein [Dermacentor albipictus]|uniref:uncharacterized protein isoform X2 n=1 Tax=Dermacentor albipictus TaxID=60249 RepID=UPI0038FBF742
MAIEQSTKPLTTANTTTMASTASTAGKTTTYGDKMDRLHEAGIELVAAAVILALVMVAAVALIVIKIKRVLDAYPLLCTYGMHTNQSTQFPDDGLCDLIFFDSAYKDNTNLLSLPSSFGENMNAFLSAARHYGRTDFGVAFAYEYRFKLRVDLTVTNPVPLEEIWKRGISDFGIVDMPAFGVQYNDIQETFATLKELKAVAERKADAVRPPYIVLGAVPLASAGVYASKMRNLFTPTMFISQGHYAFGDSHVTFCRVTPTTLLRKGTAWRDYPYDLTEAVAALQKIKDEGGSAKLLVSVGMKSRLTTVAEDIVPSMYTAPCIHDVNARAFNSYVEICTDNYWRSRLQYNNLFTAMYAADPSDSRRFVYDDEYSLCQKMCSIKGSLGHRVRFGIAVYDLEYEDYLDRCSWLNKFGAFSRVKMVRKIVDYFRNSEDSDLRECPQNLSCDTFKYVPPQAG